MMVKDYKSVLYSSWSRFFLWTPFTEFTIRDRINQDEKNDTIDSKLPMKPDPGLEVPWRSKIHPFSSLF